MTTAQPTAELRELNRRHTIEDNLRLSLASAQAAYDLSLVRLMRLQPTDEGWTEAYEEVQVAANVVREYVANQEKGKARQAAERAAAQTKAEQEQAHQPEPTKVEQQPEPKQEKVKSVPQQKAEDNARIALMNKGKSIKDKAEALDVPPATVRKVEKAKGRTTSSMTAAELRKLANELKVDCSEVNWRSSKARGELQEKLQEASKKAPTWEGLSPSRQAQLNKLTKTNAN